MKKLLYEQYINRMLEIADVKKSLTEEQQAQTVLNGMNNAKARNIVGKIARGAFHTGLYKDESWEGVTKIFNAFKVSNIDYDLVEAKYSPEFPNTWKRWVVDFPFINDRGIQTKLQGTIMAAGAGSVEQPLDRYDLNFTVY